MCKKLILLTVAVLSVFTLPSQAFSKNDEITMLVMPREAIPLQIAQDISRRYPVMIVSYQMVRGDLKIHAWNGDSWVFVSVADYTNGTFFANRPSHAVVVENERLHAPSVMTPSSTWCATANRLASTNPRVLIHLLGLYFDFPYRYWDQFAKRYGYPLEEINPTLQNVHWWNLRGDVLIEKRAQRNFSVDLDKWYYLETLPPPAVAPVVMEVQTPAAPAGGAATVNISAKAPETPVEKAPAAVVPAPAVEPVKTAEPVIEPVKAVKPAPIAEVAPAVEAVKTAEPVKIDEPAPVIEPVATEEPAAPAAEAEKTAEPPAPAPIAEPAETIDVDPFSADEIPAAEIVVPQEPKKRWWNIF